MKTQTQIEKDSFETIRHFKNGQLHRDAGPAVIMLNGYTAWYKNGKLHRLDGPAIEWKLRDGVNLWYKNGKLLF